MIVGLGRRRRGRRAVDAGFTLVEVLVATLITSLILGALASAFMISVDNTQGVSNRLSDSLDAQISGAYFVRDVQGAGEVTVESSLPGPYLAGSPELCPPGPAPGTLLVALYHLSTGSVPAFDVGYWQVGSGPLYQVVRYSCSVSALDFATSAPVKVVMADNVKTATATIEPPQLALAAASGWTETATQSTVTGVSSTTISVVSTSGFANGDVNLETSLGTELLTGCSVGSPTSLACTNAGNVGIAAGDSVSQDSITDVNLSVSQAPVNLPAGSPPEYHYSLSAAPRTQAPWGEGPGAGPGGGAPPGGGQGSGGGPGGNLPGLLTLAGGVSLNGNTNLTINGSAEVDGNGGSVSCTGTSTLTATALDTYDSSLSGCRGLSATPSSYMPDPLAPYLPACFPRQPSAAAPKTVGNVTYYYPGRYTSTIPPTNSHGTFYFEPGVYELDGGINVTNNQTISIDPGAPTGEGLLFYVPGAPPATGATPGCAYSSESPTTSLGAQGTAFDLPPLSATQSADAFSGDTALAGVWIWQDHSNSSPASLGGGSSAASPGLAYLPSAQVTLYGGPQAGSGEIICASLVLKGGSTVTLSG